MPTSCLCRAEVDIRTSEAALHAGFKSQLEIFQSNSFGRCQDMSPVNQVYIAVIGELDELVHVVPNLLFLFVPDVSAGKE